VTATRVTVLGGDAREVHLARRLAGAGYECTSFGLQHVNGGPQGAASAVEAVTGSEWLICPFPGMADGNRVYAPASAEPIVLDERLLAHTEAGRGGIILGRLTSEVARAAATTGIPIFEMKDDRALATRLSTGVAEGLLSLLIQLTTRILRDHRIVLNGYGTTGAVILDYLVGAGCSVSVIARRDLARERARQRGATPVAYDDRVAAFADAEVIVNTIPDVEAVPTASFPLLAGTLIVDIASPPGGIDHASATAAGLRMHWARGLAGARAPETAGDAQFGFVQKVISMRAADATAASASALTRDDRRPRP
jgi:dipicolinate synthase subunit A